MPNPKHRMSKSRRDKRRANHKLDTPTVSLCPHCQEVKLPHRICLSCGYYHGQEIIKLEE